MNIPNNETPPQGYKSLIEDLSQKSENEGENINSIIKKFKEGIYDEIRKKYSNY